MLFGACGCGLAGDRAAPSARAISRRVDPTQTRMVVLAWQRELVRRLTAVRRLVRQSVRELDVLGLSPRPSALQTVAAMSMGRGTLPARGLAHGRASEKVDAFAQWVKQTLHEQLVGSPLGSPSSSASRNSWQNRYIQQAYRRGMLGAAARLRARGAKIEVGAGVPPPTMRRGKLIRDAKGGKKGSIGSGPSEQQHRDRIELIQSRAYNELEGISNTAAQKITRIVSRGVQENWTPEEIAGELDSQIRALGEGRARTIARTETVAAYSEASLNAFEEAGIEGVTIEAEFVTAGDDDVCPECDSMEGDVMSIDEARGLIPVHPNCRCAFNPVVEQ